jgi:Ni,Fe-hydrogenase III large subunit
MKNQAVLADHGLMANHAVMTNGGSRPLSELPLLTYEQFAAEVLLLMGSGARVVAYFAVPPVAGGSEYEIIAVLGQRANGHLAVIRGKLARSFLSLTPQCPQLHLFEREIAEQYGLVAKGHPWLKPLRFHAVWEGGQDAWQRPPGQHPAPGEMEYFRVEGEEIHEVAVGPVHAGVIEPGHFRFQCFGEKVLHLEISLGYQHRGIEQLLAGGPHPASASQIETMAGDTTIGHMTAYSQVLEGLAEAPVSARARQIRAIALELERLANHVGDMGALAADVGFLPTSAFCGRLRGDYLNMSAAICGSRFGRGLVRPGGVVFDIEPDRQQRLKQTLAEVAKNTDGALDLFFNAPSVLGRLEGVGVVSAQDAEALGLVGVAGRACGQDCDVRRHYPLSFLGTRKHDAFVETTGDVFARAKVRQREVQAAHDFIRQELGQLSGGELSTGPAALAPSSLSVSLVEGWRGQIAHVAITDGEGRISRYKVVDPSFFNWNGLAMALRNEEISDFPLCNKSFNLSYCGFDL